ncbi:hypothetical protein [Cupriavidus sp. 2SB]|uniref:hypothetical protein n=1 Tax=Cupriavidus sp. 2SB TaxID=2502199 RepID=UPI0010F56E93|nr:hypothetical protein [Cupriavidus sp. 2SB]
MSEAATGQTQTDSGVTQTDGATTTTVAETTTVDQQQQQQGTEQTGKEGATAEAGKTDDQSGKQGTDDAKPTPKAPEQYTDFTAPEGTSLDSALTGDLKTLAKELDLSQEDAQKVADLGVKHAQSLVAKQAEALTAAATEWEAQARADTEYGGDAFEANLGVAKKAVDAFATPELKKLLNDTRLGSHPEMIRFMVRAGKAISEDRFVGGRAASGTRSVESRLYANTKQK